MDFSSEANENFEGLLEVNREIFMPQMAEKTSPDALPNCAAVPYLLYTFSAFTQVFLSPETDSPHF